jgi:spermidine/putrescine transport system substrate-binding protein
MLSLRRVIIAASALAVIGLAGAAQAETLRLLTWGGYAPDAVVEAFEKETGIDVEVTLSNNEDMISKLRATGGAGFDLAQPSQDRITGPQVEFGIYKPMDLSKVDTSLFIADLLESTKTNTNIDGQVYGIAAVWGTSGMVVDRSKAPDLKSWADLCDPAYAGKVSMRLKRTILLGIAFAAGEDPFAAYGDPAKYTEIMERAGAKLGECKANVKAYWSGEDDLLAMLRSGEIVATEGWDQTGFKLNKENSSINFVAPTTGALGWIDTFALPAKGENDEAAYKWINFVMKPENAAKITEAAGAFAAANGVADLISPEMRAAYNDAFPPEVIANIKWFPAVPAGLEEIEGKILDRVSAQ